MPAACKPLILLDFYRSFNDTPTTLEQSLLCSSFSAKSRAPTTCSLACALTTTLVATGFLRLGRLRRPLEDSGVLHLFYQHRTKIPENLGFRGFFVAKSYFAGWLKISDPHRDPHAEMKQRNQWTQEWRTGKWASCPAHFSFCRYRTCSMKLPMAAAASFCFCLVALV